MVALWCSFHVQITQQKEEKIEALKSHIEHLQHTIEDTEEAKIGLKVRLESVQKTSDDLTAQVIHKDSKTCFIFIVHQLGQVPVNSN